MSGLTHKVLLTMLLSNLGLEASAGIDVHVTLLQVLSVLTPLLVIAAHYYTSKKQKEIHLLVNSRMDETLKRVLSLETALNLKPGEAVEHASTVTPGTP